MKKFFLMMITILLVTASACKKNSSEDWKSISGLFHIEEKYVVEYYIDYVQGPPLLVEEEEKVIEKYRESYPEEFEKMSSPIPVKIDERQENVILFSDEEGNIYMTSGEETTKIGTIPN